MELKEERGSIWRKEVGEVRFGPLTSDTEADVVIIGAGITGLTAAALQCRPGKRIVVLERDQIGAGTSGGTTAHLSAMIDARYQGLIKSHGAERARAIAGSMMEAIRQVETLTKELGIDCQFERVPGYYFAESADGAARVEGESQAAAQAGLSVRLVERAPLPFPTALAAEVDDQAQLHPLRYLLGLARTLQGEGCRIFDGTWVSRVEDGDPCKVKTVGGTVRAREVILATHTPLGVSLLQTALEPVRSFVLAGRVERGTLRAGRLPGLFWDTADPYHYLRSHSGENGDLLIIGGRDHGTAKGSSEESQRALEAYVRQRFGSFEAIARWSAQFYEPADGLPSIGKNPFQEHVHVATGFGGDGMVFGTLAGMILANLIQVGRDPRASLYHPARLSLSGAGSWIAENVGVVKHMVGDRLGARGKKALDSLALGEGVVIKHKGSYAAVRRDPAQGLQALNAVCPHLKCIVHWNDAEGTWDCPCHGSRFGTDGRVLEGPAMAPLERIDLDPG